MVDVGAPARIRSVGGNAIGAGNLLSGGPASDRAPGRFRRVGRGDFGVTPLRHWFDTRQPSSRFAAGGSGSGAPTGLQFLWAGAVLSVAAAVVAVILTATSPGHRQARLTSPTGRSARARLASPGPLPGPLTSRQEPCGRVRPPPGPPVPSPSHRGAERGGGRGSCGRHQPDPGGYLAGIGLAGPDGGDQRRRPAVQPERGDHPQVRFVQAPVLCPSQTACQATCRSMSIRRFGPGGGHRHDRHGHLEPDPVPVPSVPVPEAPRRGGPRSRHIFRIITVIRKLLAGRGRARSTAPITTPRCEAAG